MRRPFLLCAVLLIGGAIAPSNAHAQRRSYDRTPEQWLDDCRHDDAWGDDREVYCELRDTTLAASKSLTIDGRQNGSVVVHGWDRADMRVVAKVRAQGETETEARDLARDLRVVYRSGRISVEGPSEGRQQHWSVGLEVWLPRQSDLDLEAFNGGIGVDGVAGRLDMQTMNGGIALRHVSGDVRGSTTNGGVTVELDGDRWNGTGLDLRTTNGGVSLSVPERYNARLETGTVNGGMSIDFPITVQGSIGRRFTTTLGNGGPPIRVTTTNGGVRIRKT